MLQEEQTVTFQPEFVWVHTPLYVGLFRLYLVLTTFWAVFRFARFLWSFRRQRIAQRKESSAGSNFWELSLIKARSFKTLSQLTLLAAVIVLTWTLSDNLTQVYLQKISGLRVVAGAFADALWTFSAATIVATGLFCCAAFCERLIHRQRLGLTGTRNKVAAPPGDARR